MRKPVVIVVGAAASLVLLGSAAFAQTQAQKPQADEAESSRACYAVAKDSGSKAVVAAALAKRKSGDENGTLSCLMQGLKALPDSVELLTDFGIQATDMGIYHAADKALAHAHTLAPENPMALYALAHVELDEQNMTAAEKHLRAYLKMRPDDASAHYGMGHLLHMLVQDDAARAELKRSIALQPRQTASYYELGEIDLDMHEDAQAKAEYQTVLAFDPHHGGALTGMGVLAYRAKDYAGAAKWLRSAVQYAPDYVKAHEYYAMTLAALGRKGEAKQESALAQKLMVKQNNLRSGYFLKSSP